MRNSEILDSWKAIADYLDRKIRTCYRWEKELGLPVYRIDNDSSRSKVFTYKSEIDQWLRKRAKAIKKKSTLKNNLIISRVISASAILIIICLGMYTLFKKSSSNISKNKSIAILPFENLNFTEYEEYISEGIACEIINGLSTLKEINVIPKVSFGGNDNSLGNEENIYKKFNIDYILKGKIQKNDIRIRIYVKLIRQKDDECIWEEKYDCRMEEIFFVQQNICRKISEFLNVNPAHIVPSSFSNGNTYDYEALNYYLKGNYVLNNINNNNNDPWKLHHQGIYYRDMGTKEGNDLAIKLFNQAIHIDKNFARAYVGLAQCYSNYVNFNWDFSIKWIDKAENLIKQAQSISSDLPEYYSFLIQIYLIKYLGFNKNTMLMASELAREGIEKYPDNPRLNSIIGYLHYTKFGEEGNEADFNKSLAYKEKSFWMNPSGYHNIAFTELLMINREYFKAINVCNSFFNHDPSLMFKFRLGEIHYYAGDLAESEAIFKQFESRWEYEIGSLFYLGMISSQNQEFEKAEMTAQKVNTLAPDFFENKLKMASIYLGIGNRELGFECLDSFFDSEGVRKRKFIYYKYIDIDKNFIRFKEEIRRKYYGEK